MLIQRIRVIRKVVSMTHEKVFPCQFDKNKLKIFYSLKIHGPEPILGFRAYFNSFSTLWYYGKFRQSTTESFFR